MKAFLRSFGILFCVMFLLLPFAVHADAAEKPTVIYVCDSGDNEADGLTPETAVRYLSTAYDKLDLTKDCTVVICGTFTQNGHFAYENRYTGSVTLTGVWGGVDYNAVYNANNVRFVCAGDTRFENMTFNATGAYMMVVGQHCPVTVGEGVAMTGGFTGTQLDKCFTILGGYQSGQSSAPASGDEDTSITVLSGSKLCLVGYCRGMSDGSYTGDAHILVGGDAEVSLLYLSTFASPRTKVGNIELSVLETAQIGKLYGLSTNSTSAKSVQVKWLGGSIGAFEWSDNPAVTLTVEGEKALEASTNVQTASTYRTIAGKFTTTSTHTHSYDAGVVVREATCTEKGETVYTCTVCKAEKREEIGALNHAWTVDDEGTPATCTTPGRTPAEHCIREGCGATRGGEETPLAAHTPGEWTVDVPATEEHEGRKVQKCTKCGELLDSCVIPRLEKVLTDADRAVIAVLISALRRNTYTVRFDTTGAAQIKSQSVKDGARATIPETPVREGYTFGGWYTDRTYWFEFDFTDPIRKNTTIIAKWIPNEIK